VPESETTKLFIELGSAIVGLAILARIANYWGFSAIPLYLLAGLAFGNGGLAPLNFSKEFVHKGADIGVLLLLFMLGLEYTGDDLKQNLRSGMGAGFMDFALNFPVGFAAGLFMGWKPLPAALLGGATYISSSGIAAKILEELGRLTNRETPLVLSVLVIEDLVMAVYLPLVGALLVGGGLSKVAVPVLIAIGAVCVVLFAALRYGRQLSNLASHQSDEIILLTILGTVLVVAGIAQRFQVSAAIGAFLVGIAVSGPMAERSHHLFAPLRDLFAATFFFFFGLEIDPASLLPVAPFAAVLAFVSALTKLGTGWWAGWKAGLDRRSCLRAGAELIARGEFSIVIAGLGVGLEPQLGPVAAAYVLLLAIVGPVVARFTK
jgi:CPA2 family monovalent cation:H+ antiporter-2